MKLARLVELGRTVRVVGFDDAPFSRTRGAVVPIVGVVCADTRFEGMLWGRTRRDGWGATDALVKMVTGSKFHPQVHVILLDGIALGGFNVIDLPALAAATGLPCVAVMRRPPNMDAVRSAVARLPGSARRMERITRAGAIYQRPPFTFQVQGAEPDVIARVLTRLTWQGHVPEALRLAHLIGSAVKLGESTRRA